MVKLKKALLILFVLALLNPINTFANEPNNHFGIHIVDENDLPEAAALVNSSGGEWGYVTVVIREDERDVARWQKAFDQMRRLKLIPIVRIATKMNHSYWEVPKIEEANNWAGFLNSLNWPIKKRYVVLFNEPNHAKEWGGIIDPSGFAKITRHYYETFKRFSKDFFIMQGAIDLAAPNSPETMEASRFFNLMHTADNFIFTLFDGLASHSYPNPGFLGNASDIGKTSIKGYKWELNYLSGFGMTSDIPIFITETGWINEKENIEENYKKAFEEIWTDKQIIAITPFLLNYEEPPFDIFSWKNPKTREFLPHYYSIQKIAKQKGQPVQIHSFEFIGHNIAEYLVGDSEYSFSIILKNTGQSIWNHEDGFKLIASSTMDIQNIKLGSLNNIEPNQTTEIPIKIITKEPRGIHTISFSFYKDDKKIADVFNTKFTLVTPPAIDIFASFLLGDNQNISLAIYDKNSLVAMYKNLLFIDGKASIEQIKDIIPNKEYKFELIKPFYFRARRIEKILIGRTKINFGIQIPIKPIFYYFTNPLPLIVNSISETIKNKI